MGDVSDNVSFVHPRNPSLFFGNRLFEAGKTNLLSRFEDEAGQTRVSKDEKIKVYLRIKPTKKNAAQMLAPPQASETCVLCVGVLILQRRALATLSDWCPAFLRLKRRLILKG
jgi:hypothetical protein